MLLIIGDALKFRTCLRWGLQGGVPKPKGGVGDALAISNLPIYTYQWRGTTVVVIGEVLKIAKPPNSNVGVLLRDGVLLPKGDV